jgi:DNA repair protein RadC
MNLREMASVYLTDADILATLLQTGSADRAQSLRQAQELLSTFGSLRAVMEGDRRRLGKTGHARLLAAFERVRRVMEEDLRRGDRLDSPVNAAAYLRTRLRHYRQEVFAALFLDVRKRLIAFEEIFYGTIDGATIHPREVVVRALAHNAHSLIVAHNHPSGLAEPSTADMHLTKRLGQALNTVDIRLLDHCVVGDREVVSLAERGLM